MAEEREISPLWIIPVGVILGIGAALGAAVLARTAPAPPPGRATLYGEVTDSVTGEAISGALITLDGSQAYSDADGNYIFEDFDPGEYTLQFSKENKEVAMADITLYEGTNELNVPLTPIPPPVANLNGVVTDAQTGSPLSGVKVTINGLVTYTNANGAYSFEELTPGSYTITFEKDGYETAVR